MCGIFGCVGVDHCLPVLIDGLANLQYRGHDSAGVAYFDKQNKINIYKKVGRVENLKTVVNFAEQTTCGIAHTRWATHGGTTETNCHPHTSGKITLIHNGIIENYSELKKEFINQLKSETDSEIIAKIIDNNYLNNFKNIKKKNKKILRKILIKSINDAIKSLKGAWAVALICADIPNEIYVFKNASPIIIAEGNKCKFISSDYSAINLNIKNKKLNYFNLNDNEIAVLNNKNVEYYDINLNKIKKNILNINIDETDLGKAGFEHYMLKEIYEVPDAVEKTMHSILTSGGEAVSILKECKQLTIIGCGTAYHAGLVGKFYFEKMLNKKAEVQLASEFRYNKQIFSDGQIVLGISQSGETADTIAGLKLAKSEGLKTIVITNVKNSTITEFADFVIYTEAGKETAVAATKSFNSQVAALFTLFMLASGNSKIDTSSLKEALRTEIKNFDNKTIFEPFFNKKKFFFIGRDVDATISLEAALKLKEITYSHSEGYPAGELKHGTLSLVDDETAVIAIITQKQIAHKTLNALHEAGARGAKTLIVSQLDLQNEADYFIRLEEAEEEFLPILAVVPFQLFAYYVAKNKGYDPDNPRNLAKSVTVE